MKKNALFIGLLTVGLVFSLRLSAQSVSYQYDNAGNRTARVINMQSSPSMRSSEDVTEIVSLDDLISGQKIKIYPNPTEGMLAVEITDFTEQLKAEILIADMSGRIISKKKMETGYASFDLTRQSQGIYVLKIAINGESVSWKIIKK